MTLAERLNGVLVGLLALPDSGTAGTPALDEQAAVVRWAAVFDRMLKVAERDLAVANLGEAEAMRRCGAQALPAADARSAARQRENRRILEDYVGVEPIDVGFVFRKSTDAVRRQRLRDGRDAETGERVRREAI